MDIELKIHLAIYDGPLDLLLDLIRKQQIDIYDIPIASITEQYLDYLHMMEEMDIDLAGEFLLMAATLILIKSRMLLPPDPLQTEGESGDPRAELVRRLLEHEKFKNAAQMLHEKQLVESSTWSRPGISDFVSLTEEAEIQVTLFDLIATFKSLLERAKEQVLYEIERDEMTVGQVIEKLRLLFVRSQGTISMEEIFLAYRIKRNLVVAFLAILEMVHFKALVLIQKKTFGEIIIRRQENFEEVMTNLDHWMGVEIAPGGVDVRSGNRNSSSR
jgi:segregation and condensation protein A